MTGPPPGPGLFDIGLQPERTDLAWRRTAITVVLGAVVSLRLLPLTFGLFGLVLAFLTLLTAGALYVLVRRRAVAVSRALVHRERYLPDGLLALALSLASCGGGLCGLAYVLFGEGLLA